MRIGSTIQHLDASNWPYLKLFLLQSVPFLVFSYL